MRADGPPPEVRRRWGIVTTLAVLLAVVVVTGHRCMAGSVYDRHVERGSSALSRAMGGESTAYDDAIDEFRQAAVIGMIDGYPVFLLNASQRMKACGESSSPTGFYCALASGRCEAAKGALHEFEADKARDYAERLVAICRSVEESVVD